jgi:NADH:ubiquinone oxidoreductase subunit E
MEEKKEIVICLGSSCFARGNNKNLEFIQEYLKVNDLKAKITFKAADRFASGISATCSNADAIILSAPANARV